MKVLITLFLVVNLVNASALKVNSEVKSDLETSNKARIPILVQLTPADLTGLPANTAASTNLDVQGSKVVDTLSRHSLKTKGSVEEYLKRCKASGKIDGYRYYSISNTYALEATQQIIDALTGIDEVEEISSNKKVKSEVLGFGNRDTVIATDFDWSGKEVLWSIKYINATNLPYWVRYNASKLRYANSDTGVDYKHPILAKNYLGRTAYGYNHNYVWWDSNKKANATNPNKICGIDTKAPCDDDIHGTHTMGTVVGSLNLGISPTTGWLACKNMDQGLGSPETYLGCLQFLIAPTKLDGTNPRPELRPHVVGNSYGCPGSEGCSRSTFKYALRAMKLAGIFMSVSAGNTGLQGCSSISAPPATDPNSFVVAATEYKANSRALFSSLGPTDQRYNAIDIAAPGVNITSAIPGGKFAALQGTSMASPHVSGAALLVIAACPNLMWRVDAIANLLKRTATPAFPILGCGKDGNRSLPNNEFGYGILNVAKAIQYCQRYAYYY